jgi:hypothetical protein
MQERDRAIELRLRFLRATDGEVHLAQRMAGVFQLVTAHRASREQAGHQCGRTERVADHHVRSVSPRA